MNEIDSRRQSRVGAETLPLLQSRFMLRHANDFKAALQTTLFIYWVEGDFFFVSKYITFASLLSSLIAKAAFISLTRILDS